jgi:hypothetical protein
VQLKKLAWLSGEGRLATTMTAFDPKRTFALQKLYLTEIKFKVVLRELSSLRIGRERLLEI